MVLLAVLRVLAAVVVVGVVIVVVVVAVLSVRVLVAVAVVVVGEQDEMNSNMKMSSSFARQLFLSLVPFLFTISILFFGRVAHSCLFPLQQKNVYIRKFW